MFTFFLLSSALAAAPDCLPAATWIDRAKLDLIGGEGGRAALDAALQSMKCADVTPAVLADWFRAEGVSRALKGDTDGAARAFAAAKRLAPAPPDPAFGAEFGRQYEAASRSGTLPLEIDSNRDRVWVDTVRTPLPANVAVGDHYVEVRDGRDDVVYNRVLDVSGDTTVLLTTGLPELPAAGRLHPKRPWLVASAGSVVLAGAAFTASALLLEDVEAGQTLETARADSDAMNAFAVTGVGLGGAAVALLGVSFVVK